MSPLHSQNTQDTANDAKLCQLNKNTCNKKHHLVKMYSIPLRYNTDLKRENITFRRKEL